MIKRKIMSIGLLTFCLVATVFIGVTTSEKEVNEDITQFPWTKTIETPDLATAGTAASCGWLSGWLYRKAHNITGSTAGVQVNYPMMINVHYDNGFDSEGAVYLDGKCRMDFGDIRFTDLVGNSLDYWMHEKVDGVQAIFWVEIGYIPQSPDYTTLYIYYGNPNASTTSNKDWTLDLVTFFEDNTTQEWTISWVTHVKWDGTSNDAYQGNYCRGAGRQYGSLHAGTGHFYERFQKTEYLAASSYHLEGVGRFEKIRPYFTPIELRLLVAGTVVDSVNSPGTEWHHFSGEFTLNTSGFFVLEVEFHLQVGSALQEAGYSYYIDSLLLRKWCDPEPVHGSWGTEETSADKTPPEILSVEWRPTCPYPYAPSNTTRANEPVLVTANVSEPVNASGIDNVLLSYRVDGGEWWNTTMTYNATSALWTTIIPGQLGNTTIEFFIIAYDKAGNMNANSRYSYPVMLLVTGDVNGDGIVDIIDLVIVAIHFGETW